MSWPWTWALWQCHLCFQNVEPVHSRNELTVNMFQLAALDLYVHSSLVEPGLVFVLGTIVKSLCSEIINYSVSDFVFFLR